MFKTYYQLTKPGIIYGNLLTTTGGFLLAARGDIDGWLLLATLAGTALVIASGCVFNNWLDRGIDAKMARTKRRATVSGEISVRNALIFATSLGVLGFLILGFFTTGLTALIGLVGIVFYVIIYGYAKRNSVHGTLVGTIPGATPPIAGYCAAAGQFDTGALLIGLIMVCWQMSHFYSIAIYRLKDYKAAGIPVRPAVKGLKNTKLQINLYIVAFIGAVIALSVTDYAGYTFAVVMAGLGLIWLYLGIKGTEASSTKWARQMFKYSLIVITGLALMLSLDSWLV